MGNFLYYGGLRNEHFLDSYIEKAICEEFPLLRIRATILKQIETSTALSMGKRWGHKEEMEEVFF